MKGCPQTRVDVRTVEIGSELFVYDDRKRLQHHLNSTARRIWELCDGTHSVDEIVAEIRRLFPGEPEERVRADVERTLELMRERELLVWVTAEVPREDR